MDYQKHYDKLIIRAQCRILGGYVEKHHIIPICIGGNNDLDNIVQLTAREHYVAHQLLIKIYPRHYGLIHAAMLMCVNSYKNIGRSKNRYYGWIKELHSKNISNNQKGSGNSQYGKCWIYSDELKESKTIPKQNLNQWLQLGYKKGRKIIFGVIKLCKKCGQEICKRPDICQKHQMINTLITFFNFDSNKIGTDKFYDEYNRIVELLKFEYFTNRLSTVEITKKYKITSVPRLDNIFRSLGIQHRSHSEATKNYLNRNR